jgi:uncharacterized protein (TIGR02145 family)
MKNIIGGHAGVVLVVAALFIAAGFAFYSLTRAAANITLNINNGAVILEVPKGGSGTFELTNTSTSNSSLGYTVSAFNRTSNGDITIVKCNNSNCTDTTPLSADIDAPTEIESTSGAADRAVTTTRYQVTVAAGVTYDTYDIVIGYHFAEKKPTLANAITDVYPSTGFAGDTIKILNYDGAFTNNKITSVTVGGTPCDSYVLISDKQINCTLPDKATGTAQEVAVKTNNGAFDQHNFKVNYIDPANTVTNVDCGTMNQGDTVYLRDIRNNQTYRVRKMADNKCWMLDNLKYTGEAGVTIPLNKTVGRHNTVDGTDNKTAANFDTRFYNNPMTESYCYGTDIETSLTKCGYLYNWYAATDGTGTYNTTNGNVTGHICPANLKLPRGSLAPNIADNDFAILNGYMVGQTSASIDNNYGNWIFSGFWNGVYGGNWGNTMYAAGANSYYWSSTANSADYAHYLSFSKDSVNPINSYLKSYGRAVRCLVD